MNIKTSLILGISIIISVFLSNYYSDDRYSFYYAENEEYSNFFVSYVTDKMTGNVKRISYNVFKDPEEPGQISSVRIEHVDMGSGERYNLDPTMIMMERYNLDPTMINRVISD